MCRYSQMEIEDGDGSEVGLNPPLLILSEYIGMQSWTFLLRGLPIEVSGKIAAYVGLSPLSDLEGARIYPDGGLYVWRFFPITNTLAPPTKKIIYCKRFHSLRFAV
jgi:hypothetical protein